MRKGTKKKLKSTKEASLPFYLRSIPKNLQTLQKFKVSDFRDVSITLTAPHCHSSSLDILSSSVSRKANIICLLFIVSQTCFNKNDFLLLLNNGFSLFFELLEFDFLFVFNVYLLLSLCVRNWPSLPRPKISLLKTSVVYEYKRQWIRNPICKSHIGYNTACSWVFFIVDIDMLTSADVPV